MPGVTEKQPGKEAVALICTGDAFNLAESIWQMLQSEGIRAQLIRLRCLKPLNKEMLLDLGKTCRHIYTFENGSLIGGVGAHITQILATSPATVRNFGYPDEFIPHGRTDLLLEKIGFTAEHIGKEILGELKA
jgi:deoxyxylulose-5-phosphate synthase